MTRRERSGPQVHLGHLALVYAAFGILALLTALVYGGGGEPLIPAAGAAGDGYQTVRFNETVGPVSVREADTVLDIRVSKPLPQRSWAYVEVEILDEDKTRLLSLGDEVWRDSGVDQDGAWSENVTRYSGSVVLDEPGRYYFRVVGEPGSPGVDERVGLAVAAGGGSTVLFWVAGLTALAIAFVLHTRHRRSLNRRLRAERQGRVVGVGPWGRMED